MEYRRRPLRQPEQPQRLELDLPVEAHYPHLREGHARTHADRLPPAHRRNVTAASERGRSGCNLLPFFVGAGSP